MAGSDAKDYPGDTFPAELLECGLCGGFEATRKMLEPRIERTYSSQVKKQEEGGEELDSLGFFPACLEHRAWSERYRVFFQGLIDVLNEEYDFNEELSGDPYSAFQFKSAYPQIYYEAGFTDHQNTRIGLRLSRDMKWNKWAFDELAKIKDTLESEFGVVLVWERDDENSSSLVAVTRPGTIYDDAATLEATRDWMIEKLLDFKRVLGPRLSQLVKDEPL